MLASPGPDWKTGGPGVDTSQYDGGLQPPRTWGPSLDAIRIKDHGGAVTPSNLVHAYTNEGVVDDTFASEIADSTSFDLAGSSFSRQALALAGARSETTVTVGAVPFWLPRLDRQALNNVVADGQSFDIADGAYQRLWFIGAGSNRAGGSGDVSGALTLTYTDGSRESVTLALNDWRRTSGGYLSNRTAFATNGYVSALYDEADAGNLTRTGKKQGTRTLWRTSVPVDPAKTLKSVQWPSQAGDTFMHVFSMTTQRASGSYQTLAGSYGATLPKPYHMLSQDPGTVRASATSTAEGNPYLTLDGKKGRNETAWVSATLPASLDIDLWHRKNVKKVAVYSGQALTGGNRYVKPLVDFKLQYWTGAAWRDVPGAVVTGNTEFVTVLDGLSVSTSKLRVHVTRAYDDKARIFEVEILGSDSADPYPDTLPSPDPSRVVLGDAYVPDTVSHLYEAEDLTMAASSGDAHTRYPDPAASRRAWMKYGSATAGDYVSYTVNVPEPGLYTVYGGTKAQPGRARSSCRSTASTSAHRSTRTPPPTGTRSTSTEWWTSAARVPIRSPSPLPAPARSLWTTYAWRTGHWRPRTSRRPRRPVTPSAPSATPNAAPADV